MAQNANTALRALMSDAANQMASTPIIPNGFVEPTGFFNKTPATAGTLNLAASDISALFDQDGNLRSDPIATPGGERVTLAAAIIQASRVAGAGAHVLVRPEPAQAIAVGVNGTIALERHARHFNTIEAAPFAEVADDADVLASALPASRAILDWEASIQRSVRFELKRRDLKAIGDDVVTNEIVLSLVLGLARAADAVLLDAIGATTPDAFSIAAAAGAGVKWPELRALIGTAGNGASVTGESRLIAAGVPAELTADSAATTVGAFNRAAVAIHEDVAVTVERRNTQADLIVTAHANFIPLLPDPAKFWTVGA